MEFPPNSWFIFPNEDFETAPVRSTGELCVELMAQARPKGQLMDHWRLVLGGSKILEASVELARVIPAVTAIGLPKWHLRMQKWPADITIRRNMTSSAWFDMTTLLAANQIEVTEKDDGDSVDSAQLCEGLNRIRDKILSSCSWRWAVCASEDDRLELQLQCIPVSTTYLNSKPQFKRYIDRLASKKSQTSTTS